MINVLGRELDDATKRLQELGFTVEVREARSKKGVPNGKPYVVRQQQTGQAQVTLTFASFITEPNIPQ